MSRVTKKAAGGYEVDMCHGPLLGKIIVFAVPLILSGILQLLFNAADIIVVGRFAGSEALAAVGSTSSLINLLVNVFIGLSIGANVLVARFYGAGKDKEVEETVHTSILLSVISGGILLVVGVLLARPLLTLMGTPDNVIEHSTLYMKIYFVGMPVMLLYNFGAAILRAVGDTKRPLYFLFSAGIVNVVLNLIFVIVFSMGVAGVAWATVISQCISAALIIMCLMKSESSYKLYWKKLRIVPAKMKAIARIGFPAGLQGAIFSISNVLIQSSINSFGSVAMAGNTASSNIEGFIYNSMNAVYQTALSFTSQNFGAGEYKRMRKVMYICLGLVTLVGAVMGFGAILAGRHLLGIYSSDPEVIRFGLYRLTIIASTYYICGWMDTMVGVLRGMGYSVMPMLVSLTGACAFRVLWIFTIFAADRTLTTLYLSYPVSWGITAAAHVICYFMIRKKVERGRVY
ncbi:MATE family efflux transporter [Clostridium sp. MCC353]|uniref:MATE family efflux transporter n=1 Tax=Clostridium sp. MCC353 TaxID=2592646 RepID=UPI001C0090A4|nr:MATE family efflux transporter [Clostridium sp. MCC353]MBT9776497.1 MATE family efflux transporter [Clostridium sp. MCC353]